MKLILILILFLKRFGYILRTIAIIICGVLVFSEAIPDLKFDLITKHVQPMTEKQIIDSKKETLPLYLKVLDVQLVGNVYIEERMQKKNATTSTLSSIIYPVYNENIISEELSDLKDIPCYIVVKDTKVREKDLSAYFSQNNMIEGKYDRTTIDSETRNLLIDSGYTVAENCILIYKGTMPWSISTSLIVILLVGFLGILILLSLLPFSLLLKIFKTDNKLDKNPEGTKINPIQKEEKIEEQAPEEERLIHKQEEDHSRFMPH
jgi:hypothetical protein